MAPEGFLCSEHKNTRYKQNLFWVAHPKKGLVFDESCLLQTEVQRIKKVDRNEEKKMSVLEKFN